MKVAPLDTEFDGIAIVDGLESNQRRKHKDSAKLVALIQSMNPSFVGPFYSCDGAAQYLKALGDLASQASAGKRYLVHFECHGSPAGLKMGTDAVPWQAQLSALEALNQAMQGRLVIDLSACNGIYASKMAGLRVSPPPFYAVIGPAKKIALRCAARITEAFYRAYLGSPDGDIEAAIRAANAKLGMVVLMGIRAEAFAGIQQQGHPFRPDAKDDEVVCCRANGTVYVR